MGTTLLSPLRCGLLKECTQLMTSCGWIFYPSKAWAPSSRHRGPVAASQGLPSTGRRPQRGLQPHQNWGGLAKSSRSHSSVHTQGKSSIQSQQHSIRRRLLCMRNQQARWVHEAQNIASGTMQRWQQVKHWSETSKEVRLDDFLWHGQRRKWKNTAKLTSEGGGSSKRHIYTYIYV